MKKLLRGILSATIMTSLLLTTACGGGESEDSGVVKLEVGATAEPHAEILNFIKDDLEDEGIELVVKEFSSYELINPSTAEGSLDANFFQHTPFLESFNENSDDKLVSVGPIHIEPMGIYSEKITSLDEIKEGDKVSIPSDATNGPRALLLLEDQGLIEVENKDNISDISVLDITENPLNLDIIELDAAQLTRTMSDVTISVINTNYVLEAGLNPIEEAIVMEDGTDSPYSNILVVKEGRENEEAIQKLYEAMTSEKVREFILDEYQGAVIPAF